jgi:hypothetical protein
LKQQKFIFLIASVLITFVLISVIASQICRPSKNNVVTSAITNAVSSPQPLQNTSAPNPLAWEPVFYQLIGFLSKACVR